MSDGGDIRYKFQLCELGKKLDARDEYQFYMQIYYIGDLRALRLCACAITANYAYAR